MNADNSPARVADNSPANVADDPSANVDANVDDINPPAPPSPDDNAEDESIEEHDDDYVPEDDSSDKEFVKYDNEFPEGNASDDDASDDDANRLTDCRPALVTPDRHGGRQGLCRRVPVLGVLKKK